MRRFSIYSVISTLLLVGCFGADEEVYFGSTPEPLVELDGNDMFVLAPDAPEVAYPGMPRKPALIWLRTPAGVVPAGVHIVAGKVVYGGDVVLGDADEFLTFEVGEMDFGDMDAAITSEVGELWPNAQVPYEIPGGISQDIEDDILDAIDHWEDVTDLNFFVRSSQTSYLTFDDDPDGGCSCSRIGRNPNGAVTINHDGVYCTSGNMIHEIGHAVGLFHEHVRADRNEHVTVYWDNIKQPPDYQEDRRNNYWRYDGSDSGQGSGSGTDRHGLDYGYYDFGSIMHYSSTAFAVPGYYTMRKVSDNSVFGSQRNALSTHDLSAIARMYSDTWQMTKDGDEPWQTLRESSLDMSEVRAGHFNGPETPGGCSDIFRATGSEWRYSSRGTEAWVSLRNSTLTADQLGFADIDGDGYTDCFRATGGKTGVWKYSSGCSDAWDTLYSGTNVTISNIKFGDFQHDGKADCFYANGSSWRYRDDCEGSWITLKSSTTPTTQQIEIVDIDGDGYDDDCFYANGSSWRYRHGCTGSWITLRSSTSLTLDDIAFGHFDGGFTTDCFRADGNVFKYRPSCSGSWVDLKDENEIDMTEDLLYGRFSYVPGYGCSHITDVVVWMESLE